jgi:hypothetical protein
MFDKTKLMFDDLTESELIEVLRARPEKFEVFAENGETLVRLKTANCNVSPETPTEK